MIALRREIGRRIGGLYSLLKNASPSPNGQGTSSTRAATVEKGSALQRLRFASRALDGLFSTLV
jgi:hypothetical protein